MALFRLEGTRLEGKPGELDRFILTMSKLEWNFSFFKFK